MSLPIQEILNSFKGKKVLIIGDAMIDTYMLGDVDRISPEAPVPVLNWGSTYHKLGGAANVALNIKELGGEPMLFCLAGKDEDGQLLKSLLGAENISDKGIISDPSRKTTRKTRLISRHQQVFRVDKEDKHGISDELSQDLLVAIEQYIQKEAPEAIIFQDYNKGVLREEIISSCLRMAKEKGIPSLADPKLRNFFSFDGISLFKPNLKEIAEALQCGSEDILARPDQYVAKLKSKFGFEQIMITLSDKGIYYHDGTQGKIYPAHKVQKISDVSGAGDTVIALMSLAIAAGIKAEHAIPLANLAGGLVCEQPGVVPISLAMLKGY